MARAIVRRVSALVILMVGIVGAARAQDAAVEGSAMSVILDGVIGSVVYGIVGIIILMLGFKVFDMMTPFDLNKEIAEDDNTAAGVAVAGIMIALGLIVAAAIT